MAERNLDFDTIVDRKNTDSLKYDFAVKRGMPEDVLPLWVADMDFRTSSYIEDALNRCAAHGIFGYTEGREAYYEALSGWMKRHYDWQIEESWVVKTPGVVFALAMAVKAYTKEGEGILIQQPVYYPFSGVILDNNRKLVNSPLRLTEEGRYEMDFADLEEKIRAEQVKMMILCNPHNPVGRVWTKEELLTLGNLCKKYGVIMVSDEIHADFIHKGTHQVFAKLDKDFADFTITCTSPGKTFNIAGLQISNIMISNEELRKKFIKAIDGAGYSQLNTMGIAACEAAYRNGDEWYQAMLSYVQDNIAYTKGFLEERIPKIKLMEPEGTYLLWLDFRPLGLTRNEEKELVVQRAKLWLDEGLMFGREGKSFWRVNAACPRATLQEALERLEKAVKEMEKKA